MVYIGRNGRTLTVTTSTGQKLIIDGRRADVVACLVVELLKRAHLEESEVWSVQANVTPGQIVPHFGDTAAPHKRLKEVG